MRYFKLNVVSASEAASVLTALRGTVCIDAISGVVFADRDPLSRCGQVRDNPTLAELMSPPAPDAECAKLTRVLIPVSVQPQKYSVCNKNVMGLLERRYRVGATREQVETAKQVDIVPMAVVCINTEKWEVFVQCRNDKIDKLFTVKKRVTASQAASLLHAVFGEERMHEFWYDVRMALRGAGFFGPALVFGGAASGKTYFLRQLPQLLDTPLIYIDSLGEFLDLGESVELTFDLSQVSLESFLAAFDAAARSVAGTRDGANWTVIQRSLLQEIVSQYQLDLSAVMRQLQAIAMSDPRNPTPSIVARKLSYLCKRVEGGTCEPLDALTKPLGGRGIELFAKLPKVLVVDARLGSVPAHQRDFVRVFMVHLLFHELERTQVVAKKLGKNRAYAVIDEAHMYLTGDDIITYMLRAGRHFGVSVILSTQSLHDFPQTDIPSALFLFGIFTQRLPVDIGVSPAVLSKMRRGEGVALIRGAGVFKIGTERL